jgi:hypothetical protein
LESDGSGVDQDTVAKVGELVGTRRRASEELQSTYLSHRSELARVEDH